MTWVVHVWPFIFWFFSFFVNVFLVIRYQEWVRKMIIDLNSYVILPLLPFNLNHHFSHMWAVTFILESTPTRPKNKKWHNKIIKMFVIYMDFNNHHVFIHRLILILVACVSLKEGRYRSERDRERERVYETK